MRDANQLGTSNHLRVLRLLIGFVILFRPLLPILLLIGFVILFHFSFVILFRPLLPIEFVILLFLFTSSGREAR